MIKHVVVSTTKFILFCNFGHINIYLSYYFPIKFHRRNIIVVLMNPSMEHLMNRTTVAQQVMNIIEYYSGTSINGVSINGEPL